MSTVSYTIKRHLETGGNSDRKRSGRPKATTQSEDKFLRVNSWRDRRLTGQQLQAQLNTARSKEVSVSTVKRRLRAAGLTGRVAVRKPLLRWQNKKKRLAWAMKHHQWDYWKLVEDLMDWWIKIWKLRFITQGFCMPSSRRKDGSSVCDTNCQTWRRKRDDLGLFCWIHSRRLAQSDWHPEPKGLPQHFAAPCNTLWSTPSWSGIHNTAR